MAEKTDDDFKIKMSPEVLARQERALRSSVDATKDAVREGRLEDLDDDVDGQGGKLRGVRFQGHIPAPMQVSTMDKGEALAIAQVLTARFQKDRVVNGLVSEEVHAQRVYFVKCHFSWCGGPVIWISGDPTRPLTEDNWWSSYKPIGAYWSPDRRPHCQVCEARQRAEGVKRPSREEARGIDFVTDGYPGRESRTAISCKARYVDWISREEYDDLFTAVAGKSKQRVS